MTERNYGTMSIGVRAPVIRENDNLVEIVSNSVLAAVNNLNMKLKDKDVVAITESIVARATGNYATINDIATDVKSKYGENATIGVLFPILSRNRFAICLRGIAMGAKKVVLQLSYPSDEVGNKLISDEVFWRNSYGYDNRDFDEESFRERFGETTHEFTGIDYIEYYKDLIRSCNCEAEVIFSNNPLHILSKTNNIIACDIHTRENTKRILKSTGAKNIYGLDDILTSPASKNGGYNEKYGLLGSNKATEDKVKLFPRVSECKKLVNEIQKKLLNETGAKVEVMIYGDGALLQPLHQVRFGS
jgi:hypothetical protein